VKEDKSIGRALSAVISQAPLVSPQAFDKVFNDSLQVRPPGPPHPKECAPLHRPKGRGSPPHSTHWHITSYRGGGGLCGPNFSA